MWLPLISFPYPVSLISVCGFEGGLVAEPLAAAAFSTKRIFSFSRTSTFGKEKKGIATKINSSPQSRNPPHHMPTHRWSPGSGKLKLNISRHCIRRNNGFNCKEKKISQTDFIFMDEIIPLV